MNFNVLIVSAKKFLFNDKDVHYWVIKPVLLTGMLIMIIRDFTQISPIRTETYYVFWALISLAIFEFAIILKNEIKQNQK